MQVHSVSAGDESSLRAMKEMCDAALLLLSRGF